MGRFTCQVDIAFKRYKRKLLRVASDLAVLDETYQGIVERYDVILFKYRNKPKQLEHIKGKFAARKRGLERLYRKLRRTAAGVIDTHNRLFKDCTLEERSAKLNAILRIPPAEYRHFDRLTPDQQVDELQRLIEQYGAGSGNAGFADSLLNMPGWLDPYLTNRKKETDGSKRRAIFQHELIDRLIYAAMHPQDFKQVFFKPTKIVNKETNERKICKRWSAPWRQMRSEGRLSAIRVLIVLVMRMDFKQTLRTGKWKDGGFEGLSRKDIADLAGISVHAVKAALKSLCDLNILYRGRQPRDTYMMEGDERIHYKGLPVVRKFTLTLVANLKLDALYRASLNSDNLTPEQRQQLAELELMGEETGESMAMEKALLAARIAMG